MTEIKNLKKAAERVLKAIKNKEKIILYGDADLDGVASVIILKESIRDLGGEIAAIYFPDRETEGYGLTEKGLGYLKSFSPALLITIDLGIGNFREVKLAKKMGFEVIIIDHHEILEKLPQASIIVDPKQKDDKYYFKELATAGIAFKLSLLILGKKASENKINDLLELVAIATIADIMSQEAENKIMIKKGVESLEDTWRPGLSALLNERSLQDSKSLLAKISKIISILNVRDVENRLPASYRLLTVSSQEKAEKIIEKLIEKSLQRKRRIQEITDEIEERLSNKTEKPLVFEGDYGWDLVLLGPVASIISQRYKKPTFLFRQDLKESQGTARTPRGIDLVKAMRGCSKLLETYGGHPPAAGFRAKNENLEEFGECLARYFLRSYKNRKILKH